MKFLFILTFLYSAIAIQLFPGLPHCYLNSVCKDNLRTYVDTLSLSAEFKVVGGVIIGNFPYPVPSQTEINTLEVYFFNYNRATESKADITKINKIDDDPTIHLTMSFTSKDILESKGCIDISLDVAYVRRRCGILVEYYDVQQNVVLKQQLYYLTTTILRLFQPVYPTSVIPIREDVIINDTLRYSADLYLGSDCSSRLADNAFVSPEDYLCLSINGDDPTTKSARLSINSLTLTTEDETKDITSVATSKCSDYYGCGNGLLKVTFKHKETNITRMQMVVVLNGIETVGKNKHALVADVQRKVRIESKTIFIPEPEPEGGDYALKSSTVSIVIVILCLGLAIL